VKEIDSQALGPLNKILGLAGAGAPLTELVDGEVLQSIDVGPVVRRGGTLAGTEGVFRIVLRTVHTAGEVRAVSWQPYQPGTTGIIAPYPHPVPDGFDFWLLTAHTSRVSGSGNLTRAALRITNIQQGFGIDSNGAAVVSTEVLTIAFWDALLGGTLGNSFGVNNLDDNPMKHIGLRIPRKGAVASPFVTFSCESSATVTIDCMMVCALLPSALGQDVQV